MSYSLELDFVDHSQTEFPSPPVARVFIKTSTQDEDGFTYVTPNCVSASELDYQIDRLKKELEEIRKKAHRQFARR